MNWKKINMNQLIKGSRKKNSSTNGRAIKEKRTFFTFFYFVAI